MERDRFGVGQRPVGGADPAPAVLQPARRVAPAAAAAHDEHPYRRLIKLRTLYDMVEEAPPIDAPIASPGVDRCVGSELHVAETGVRTVAVLPRPKNQPLRSPPSAFQPDVVRGCRQRIRIPPGRHVHAGGTCIAVVPSLGPYAELLPECIERAVRPLLEQVGLVIRMVAQRRMPRTPR